MAKHSAFTENPGIIIRLEMSTTQTIGGVTKINGMMKAKYIIQIIDDLDLQANPRDSKTGAVTSAIIDSAQSDPQLFPFKTKGILLAASDYQWLDRDRIRMFFVDRSIEGILDGGHNTLAIGLLILNRALEFKGEKPLRKNLTWGDFKKLWAEKREMIGEYCESIRKNDDGSPNTENTTGSDLSFYIPVEVIVPKDPEDKMCVADFRSDLLEICEARNNNAELNASAKANQKGYFDELYKQFQQYEPGLAKRIEWKTNDGGDIKVQDIIALVWLALRQLPEVKDAEGKTVVPPAPVKLYSSKASSLKQFERFMSSPEVTVGEHGDYKSALRNNDVLKAFKLAVQIPALADYIYANFPNMYNAAGGSYGKITAVKKLNESRRNKHTPYGDESVAVASPDGFITPLVFGLTELVDPDTMEWRQDPQRFLEKNLQAIVNDYAQVLSALGWDPQKVGKSPMSYTTVERDYKMALAGMLE
ncbi:hypothetical protein CQR46_0541 [Bifidobacterium pseudolongum subsp. globosum]|uniref:Abortive phage infection protein n=1 Tax=Bifidobacterium pseudolongum subsp. globosum TaxID=1690 RepID=A0A2N3QJ72_9BIFI|nr:hypothetical protein [Bifidobacterium pseudolongum]PKU91454.1 hypothetical protein CQR46_0541 [Bifidobacterium pseudolongum subsp. globosum]